MPSIEASSIKIRPASSFLLFLTTKDLEPKYAIKTPRELDVPCEKKTWPLKSSAQAFSSLEIECVSCRNNTPLDSNLFFRYSISFNRFFDDYRPLTLFVIKLTLLFATVANVVLARSDIIWYVWEIKWSNYVEN